MNNDELYQGYLELVYQHTQGYLAYTPETSEALSQKGVCITYGELLYPSVKKMIHHLRLTPQDIFLDLGSGLGKCVLQVFMTSEAHKVIGIEASKPLHEQGMAAIEKVKTDFPIFWENNRSLELICDNFLVADWQNATSVYTCSTCFTKELITAIGDKINQEKQVTQVLSLRPLPTIKLPLKMVFGVEGSWDSTLCFFYQSPSRSA